MSLFLGLNEDVTVPKGTPLIKEVRAYVSRASEYGASDVHDTPDTHWIMGQQPHHPPVSCRVEGAAHGPPRLACCRADAAGPKGVKDCVAMCA